MNKNLYAAILASDSGVLKADTFSQPGGKNFGSGGSLLLASYTCGGTMRWARLFENRGDVVCYGIQYHAGSIYVAGRFGDTGSNPNRYIAGVKLSGHDSQHYFLARYDTVGNLHWIRFVGANDQSSSLKLSWANSPGEDDQSLAIDGNGDIHHFVYLYTGVKITPSMTAQKGTYDLKYDASGALLGAVRLGVDSSYYLVGRTAYSNLTPGNKNAVSISKKSGKIFAAMSKVTVSTSPPSQFRLCAFSPGGTLLWEDTLTRSTVNPSTGGGGLRDVAYDGANGIYVSGEGQFGQFRLNGVAPSYTPAGANRLLTAIIKVDTNGVPQWIYANEHSNNVGVLGNTTLLPNGNILAAGSSHGVARHRKDSVTLPNSNSDPFYTIVSPQGVLVSMDVVRRKKLSPYHWNSFTAAATDNVGNIYLGGMQMSDTLQFPGGPISVKAPNTYNVADAFIARMGMDCRCTVKAKASFKDSVSATDDRKVVFTYTGTTEAVDSVVWYFGKGQKQKVTSGFTTPIVRSYSSGGSRKDDTVCVTVYSACGKDTSCTYPSLLSVATPSGIWGVKVYPNPVHAGRFVVAVDARRVIDELNVSLSNISGQQVFGEVYHPGSHHFSKEIVLHDLASGVYFLVLSSGSERVVRRVVVQ